MRDDNSNIVLECKFHVDDTNCYILSKIQMVIENNLPFTFRFLTIIEDPMVNKI